VRTSVAERLLLDKNIPIYQQLINSLRIQIGDYNEEDITDVDFGDTELYIILADAADLLSTLYTHGVTFSRNKKNVSTPSAKARAMIILAAEFLIQFRQEREGTRNAIMMREGDSTIDLRTIGNVANKSRNELYKMLREIVNKVVFDNATGLRIDSYDASETWEG